MHVCGVCHMSMSNFYFVVTMLMDPIEAAIMTDPRVQPVSKREGRKLKSSLHRASKVKSIHARNIIQ